MENLTLEPDVRQQTVAMARQYEFEAVSESNEHVVCGDLDVSLYDDEYDDSYEGLVRPDEPLLEDDDILLILISLPSTYIHTHTHASTANH